MSFRVWTRVGPKNRVLDGNRPGSQKEMDRFFGGGDLPARGNSIKNITHAVDIFNFIR